MIRLQLRDRDYIGYRCTRPPRWKTVERKGKLFSVNGEEIELFKVKTLAEALDRSTSTIISWEKAGVFPKPLFRVVEKCASRWYSANQILNLHALFIHKYGGLKHLHVRGRSKCDDNRSKRFFEDIKSAFYEKDLIVIPKGGTHA